MSESVGTPRPGPAEMRRRTAVRLYSGASRLWLTAAGLSLLLPATARLGIWLPLHLALAGAVSVAISGSMQNFASVLTATPAPRPALIWTQFAAVNAGAGLIAIGYPSGRPALVAAGGASFIAGILMLGWVVANARRRSLNKRHPLPLAMYGAAIAAVLVGGILGAFIGSGAIDDPAMWVAFRRAHMTLNVLGWASLTISGTLITLLPTVLRIRMPAWHGTWTGALLVAGVALISTGLALSSSLVAAVGAIDYAAGALGVVWMVGRAIATPRRWPVPVSAKHLLVAVAWFTLGSLVLAVSLVRDVDAFDGFREDFLVVFVGGWIVQTLLGAWLYLLPMARPAHPDERKKFLAAIEIGGTLQVAGFNAGLVLMALSGAGWVSGTLGSVGAGLAIGAGGIALLKTWTYPLLAKQPALSRRALDVWGG